MKEIRVSDVGWFLSVDPGISGCGAALWRRDVEGTDLSSAGYVKNPSRAPSSQRWLDMAHALWEEFGQAPSDLVIELPRIYTYKTSKADPNDLIQLAAVAGAIVGRFGIPVWSVFPAEWKGQVPKHVTAARVEKALTKAEKSRISWPSAAGLRHNVYDAIGLGLFHARRQG